MDDPAEEPSAPSRSDTDDAADRVRARARERIDALIRKAGSQPISGIGPGSSALPPWPDGAQAASQESSESATADVDVEEQSVADALATVQLRREKLKLKQRRQYMKQREMVAMWAMVLVSLQLVIANAAFLGSGRAFVSVREKISGYITQTMPTTSITVALSHVQS